MAFCGTAHHSHPIFQMCSVFLYFQHLKRGSIFELKENLAEKYPELLNPSEILQKWKIQDNGTGIQFSNNNSILKCFCVKLQLSFFFQMKKMR